MIIPGLRRERTSIRVKIGIVLMFIFIDISVGHYLYISNQYDAIDQRQTKILQQINVAVIKAAVEAKKKQPVFITLPGASPIRAIVDDYTKTDSIWAIVNKTHPISVNYVPANLKIPDVLTRTDKSTSERSVRSDIEKPMKDMFAAAAGAGYQLMIGSGYRSATQQQIYFDSSFNAFGLEATEQSIATPGQSEHQTGLAADITTVSMDCYIADCFGSTADGQWLVNNSYKFGFILRYPEGKETITGYRYEPWHFRYVGIDLATALHQSSLTLDEAWLYLVKADATLKQNGAI